MELKYHSTVIFCSDLQEQRKFYEEFLEQKVRQDHGGYLVFENGFTLWHISKDYHIAKELGYTYEPLGNRNLELCFETDLFGKSVERVLMGDLRMLHNVLEEDWGQYTIRFYDPEGNLVEIGESMKCMAKRMVEEGKTLDQVAEKSGLPLDYIETLLV